MPELENKSEVSSLAAIALDAARIGAAALVGWPAGEDQPGQKSSLGNLVTSHDVLSERRIRETISEARPCDRIAGEELPDQGPSDARIVWSIDPLDGTMNYVRGIPYFAASVAAFDRAARCWAAAAVVAPALGREYWAAHGKGAFLCTRSPIGENSARRLHPRWSSATGRLVGTGFSYDPGIRQTQFRNIPALMESFVDLRRLGSAALEICAVADGSLDAYREDDLAVYDWAAAMLIAEEAGAVVHRPDSRSSVVAVNLDPRDGPAHTAPEPSA